MLILKILRSFRWNQNQKNWPNRYQTRALLPRDIYSNFLNNSAIENFTIKYNICQSLKFYENFKIDYGRVHGRDTFGPIVFNLMTNRISGYFSKVRKKLVWNWKSDNKSKINLSEKLLILSVFRIFYISFIYFKLGKS